MFSDVRQDRCDGQRYLASCSRWKRTPALNAWCELRSPLQQISESQPRTTKLLVEPDTEIVHGHPRRQAGSQAFQLMGPLPPEAEGIEELVVDRLDDLAYSGHPSSHALGPVPLASVSFGRMDDGCSVTLLPAPVVLNPFETFVGYVWSRADQAHTDELGVRLSSHGEEGLRQLLVGSGSSPETEACNDPGGICGVSRQKPSYHPRLLDQPMSDFASREGCLRTRALL